ncbi:MAG TPA: uroporphyrinogen decarboxylase family protein, partial [Anaerolineales bacterium]|nr:uroporphyrinogen decarboxylase family protein [Anaerolineales bacterium]
AAISHKPVDRIPTDIWAVPEIWEKLQTYLGVQEKFAVYEKLGIDGIIELRPKYIGPSLPYEVDGGFKRDFQAWGLRYKKQIYPGGVYWETIHHPLAEAKTIQDLKAYQWPDPDWYDYSSVKEQAAQYPDRAILSGYYAMFYYHNQLRGLETSLMDPALRPEFTHYLLERLGGFFYEYHTRIFEAAGDVVDLTQVTDDYGAQNNLLISPGMFDDFYREPVQRAIDLAHSFDIQVFHHDDGDIRKLLPRLVTMGIDVLNPIQWRCGDWDLDWLKREFGQKLCFHGGIDNQQTLPFGTVDDVKDEVHRIKAALGKNGTGLIIAPCHNIQANTPVENIVALYEAAQE